jgi:(1->4)-alpha-D-glucan 1-alpha-D-glucosylmutase
MGWLIRRGLCARRGRPEAFGEGERGRYRALAATGPRAEHVVAFSRGEQVITVVPRLGLRLQGRWEDTALELPPGRWRNDLTGETVSGRARLAELLARFPVALLLLDRES